MNHYFTNNEQLDSKTITIEFYFKGKKIKYLSDNGVFSKKGIDFGSATLLQYIDKINKKDEILDVGCGYGTIGLSLASIYPDSHFDLIDVNLRALDLANQNSINNNIKNVSIFESNSYQNILKKYDIIVTNPPIRAGKKVVYDIILNAKDHLKNNGSLWCVIQKKQGALSAIKELENVYQEVNVVAKEKGYYIIKAKK